MIHPKEKQVGLKELLSSYKESQGRDLEFYVCLKGKQQFDLAKEGGRDPLVYSIFLLIHLL